jgi:hypothetical protein
LSSCSKDIDERIKECYNANDTIINLADLYPEEWDTVYYFTNACNLDMVEKRVGPVIRRLYGDVGDRILILNKNKKVKDNSHLNEVVCYKEYFPNYGQKNEGSVFVFRNRQPIIAIPREKANFLIRKIDDNSFWVIHQEEETLNKADVEYAGIPVSIVNKSLLKQIDYYMDKHPNNDTLLILSDIDDNWLDNHIIQNYWIIGLAYSEFVCSRKDISLFFKYNNTTVFLQSSLKGLTDPSYIKVEYPQNRNQVNSQEAEKLFYKNAILCEQDSNGIFSFVTDEVKKRVDFVVPPIE